MPSFWSIPLPPGLGCMGGPGPHNSPYLQLCHLVTSLFSSSSSSSSSTPFVPPSGPPEPHPPGVQTWLNLLLSGHLVATLPTLCIPQWCQSKPSGCRLSRRDGPIGATCTTGPIRRLHHQLGSATVLTDRDPIDVRTVYLLVRQTHAPEVSAERAGKKSPAGQTGCQAGCLEAKIA
ncbi:unnamed protein product [Protopolystoma xenopodis]|uniref:Uncharacterized protein n=1 Tax=Protopolystoma xenopodis TaxID=117903 RepID=A0A3S5AP65_9PLAT|nr:unnamed protein product [Protopolystoma xenopodis]